MTMHGGAQNKLVPYIVISSETARASDNPVLHCAAIPWSTVLGPAVSKH